MKLSEEDIKKLGILLQNKRRSLDFTLDDVREKLEELGQNANTSDILRIERGERKTPNAILLKNLCKIYGLDVIKLFQEIGYLDLEKMKRPKIKVYDDVKTAIEHPENYVEEIELNLKDLENIIGIKIRENFTVLVKRDELIENNQKGLFKIKDDYFIRKKAIISPEEYLLLGKESEVPVIVKDKKKCEELGKVIGEINFE